VSARVLATFARNLKTLREGYGFSISEIARRSNISRRFYQQLETGDRTPALETIVKLADAFEVDFNVLFAGTSARKATSEKPKKPHGTQSP
jgi:transcriptional regulator with XRE-family HTH domain